MFYFSIFVIAVCRLSTEQCPYENNLAFAWKSLGYYPQDRHNYIIVYVLHQAKIHNIASGSKKREGHFSFYLSFLPWLRHLTSLREASLVFLIIVSLAIAVSCFVWYSEIGLETHWRVFLLVIRHGDSWLGDTEAVCHLSWEAAVTDESVITDSGGWWVCVDGYSHFLQITQALLCSISEKAVYVHMFLTAWHVHTARTCLSWVDSPVQVGLILPDANSESVF